MSVPLPDGHLRGLPPDALRRLQDALRRFEDAWRDGRPPALDDFLPAGAPERFAVLVELVHTDLELRRRAGEAAGVGPYLARYPELAADARAVGDLLAEEASLTLPHPAGAAARPAGRAGRFRLLGRLGEGSFGTVWRAEDPLLGRLVAVKVLRRGGAADTEMRQRFEREARLAARLRHPGIVTLLDVGEHDGAAFFVSELVPGVTLARRLAAGPLPPSEAAAVVRAVAEALDHAHGQGVVHRDVKPSNIQLDAAGRPHLLDFGLARHRIDSTVTASGEVLGTPAYMPPEQAAGRAHAADARGDVYSLGAVLYEALTGELPFRGTAHQVLQQVLHEDPRPPRAVNEGVPADLETVCLKSLEKEPHRRYPSAAALADDLGRFLAGEPVRARPVGRIGRAWRWGRRDRLAAGLLSLVALLLLLGSAVALALGWHAERERRRAEENLARARQHHDQLRESFREAHRTVNDVIDLAQRENWRAPLVQRQLMGRSLRYYEDFLRQCGAEGDLAEGVATAYLTRGKIRQTLGDRPEAFADYEQSRERWSRLLSGRPDTSRWRRNLAETYLRAGQLHLAADVPEAALPHLKEARSLALELVGDGAGEPESQEMLLVALLLLSDASLKAGSPEEALSGADEARALAGRLAREDPSCREYTFCLAGACYTAGAARHRLGRRAEALGVFRQSCDLWDRLSDLAPPPPRPFDRRTHLLPLPPFACVAVFGDDYEVLYARAKCYLQLARAQGGGPQAASSLRYYQTAIESFERLHRRWPDDEGVLIHLATAHHLRGNLQRDSLPTAAAIDSYRRARELRQRLAAAHAENVTYRRDLGGSCERLAQALELVGRRDEALATYREALGYRRVASELAPGRPELRREFLDLARQVGPRLRQEGQVEEADELDRQCRRLAPGE